MKRLNIKKGIGVGIFIERSISAALDFFKEAVFSEDIAGRRGLLQSIDPRIKILCLGAILISACIAGNLIQLVIIYIAAVLLALLSRIGILYYIKRAWFFIPVFTLFIAIPALFMHGIGTAALFVMRVATCVSIAILLTVTTRHSDLLKSLRYFRLPVIFVQILDMTYRYLFLFVKIFEETHQALKARLIARMPYGKGRAWIAGRIGGLFRRSARMSEEVYMAMVARGYGG